MFQYLTSKPASGYTLYRSTSVLFQLIFEWHLLEKLPRTGFLPWQVKQSTKKWAKLTKVRIYRMVQKNKHECGSKLWCTNQQIIFFSPSSINPHWKLTPFLSGRAAHVLMVSAQKRHFVLSSFSNQILQQICVVNFLSTTDRIFNNVSHLRPISICIQRLYLQQCYV